MTCQLLPIRTPAHFNSNYDPEHVINTSNRLYCVIRSYQQSSLECVPAVRDVAH